jgi:hypothetical protein
MELNKIIIIGSGPAGTWAAKALTDRGIKPLVLDIGDVPEQLAERPFNFYDEKSKGAINRKDIFLGSDYEALHSVFNEYLSPKLKSPLMRFVTKSSHLNPLKKNDFHALTTSAMGGLANAWGGHVYRFNDDELKNLNLDPKEFKKYYDIISKDLKISGSLNEPFSTQIPHEDELCPPLKLDPFWEHILKRKKKQIQKIQSKHCYLGHPRIAIDSRKFSYHNLDFFVPSEGDIYSPRFTLQKLIQEDKVEYINKFLFTEYSENSDYVSVTGKDITSGLTKTYKAEKILIACGAINSVRAVLQSEKAFDRKLPFLDNPIVYIPFLNPSLIGSKQQTESYTAQLNLLLRDQEADYFGTFYNLNSIMRSDILFDFPLPLSSAIFASRNFLQAMSILQLWAPGKLSSSNTISLNKNNEIELNYDLHEWSDIPEKVIRNLRKIGIYSHTMLSKKIAPGNSYHYAGSLPMSVTPTQFQTDLNGKLYGKNRVHIVDSSVFPSLPSKNLTYTIMANAYRIASTLKI